MACSQNPTAFNEDSSTDVSVWKVRVLRLLLQRNLPGNRPWRDFETPKDSGYCFFRLRHATGEKLWCCGFSGGSGTSRRSWRQSSRQRFGRCGLWTWRNTSRSHSWKQTDGMFWCAEDPLRKARPGFKPDLLVEDTASRRSSPTKVCGLFGRNTTALALRLGSCVTEKKSTKRSLEQIPPAV